MTDLPDDHRIGANQPPPDAAAEFRTRLERDHEALLDQLSDLEFETAFLPAESAGDEDLAAINAWVVKAKALGRSLDDTRKQVKEPYLARERAIDGFFMSFIRNLENRAKAIEQRNTPFLLARKVAAEQAARAAAKKAEEERLKLEAEAQAAQDAERAAKAKREAEEKAVAEAAEAAARATNEAERKKLEAAAQQAELNLQAATSEQQKASKASANAQEDAAMAGQAADNANERVAKGSVGKSQGGGANARVEMHTIGFVTSWPLLQQSLGPLNPYATSKMLLDLVSAASRDKNRPTVPGVEWREEPVVKTTATRRK